MAQQRDIGAGGSIGRSTDRAVGGDSVAKTGKFWSTPRLWDYDARRRVQSTSTGSTVDASSGAS